MLTAEQLHWILNRPEIKETVRIRDRWLRVKKESAASTSAAESIDGEVLIDGGQESEGECEIF